MVAASQGVDRRRAAELAAAHDDRLVQQIALPQIRHERREGRVERSHHSPCISWLLTWLSQPVSVTSTQRTPTSINRRAARQPRPNGVSPYAARRSADSRVTSKAPSDRSSSSSRPGPSGRDARSNQLPASPAGKRRFNHPFVGQALARTFGRERRDDVGDLFEWIACLEGVVLDCRAPPRPTN